MINDDGDFGGEVLASSLSSLRKEETTCDLLDTLSSLTSDGGDFGGDSETLRKDTGTLAS